MFPWWNLIDGWSIFLSLIVGFITFLIIHISYLISIDRFNDLINYFNFLKIYGNSNFVDLNGALYKFSYFIISPIFYFNINNPRFFLSLFIWIVGLAGIIISIFQKKNNRNKFYLYKIDYLLWILHLLPKMQVIMIIPLIPSNVLNLMLSLMPHNFMLKHISHLFKRDQEITPWKLKCIPNIIPIITSIVINEIKKIKKYRTIGNRTQVSAS